jgi:hypothetical protein
MSSGPTGWLPLVLTTLGAGAAGSVIATYGGQSRERRKARSQVMACLQRLEIARVTRPGNEPFYYDDKGLAELSTRCIVAGVPQHLVHLYELANDVSRGSGGREQPDRPAARVRLEEARDLLIYSATTDVAALLARTVWHPWLSVLFRRRRAKQLQDRIMTAYPGANAEKRMGAYALEEWESANAEYDEWRQARARQREGKGPQGSGGG